MSQIKPVVDAIGSAIALFRTLRDEYREYQEDHRPPSLLETYRTNEEINKPHRKTLRDLRSAFLRHDGMNYLVIRLGRVHY